MLAQKRTVVNTLFCYELMYLPHFKVKKSLPNDVKIFCNWFYKKNHRPLIPAVSELREKLRKFLIVTVSWLVGRRKKNMWTRKSYHHFPLLNYGMKTCDTLNFFSTNDEWTQVSFRGDDFCNFHINTLGFYAMKKQFTPK